MGLSEGKGASAYALLKQSAQPHLTYAATKNVSHEPVAGRVQKPPRQYPLLPPSVRDGHEGDGDIV